MNKVLAMHVSIFLFVAIGIGACANPVELTVSHYTSDNQFAVNSYLIAGQNEAILVDGQFFKADAQNVVQLIRESGKTLKQIFLTHAHPDHYAGLEEILKAFPGVPVYGTSEVVADFASKAPAALEELKKNFSGLVADNLVAVTVLEGDKLDLEGNELRVIKLREGESETAAALYAPRQKLLFSGDVLYNQAYLWLAECRPRQWMDNIEQLQALGEIRQIYAGHGFAQASATVFAENISYLRAVTALLNSAPSAMDAIASVQRQYPAYTGIGLLNFSTSIYFMNCRF